ncbi:MAG TPA: Ldh family oxidoreductase [Aestuariivirgaceae bacterium]|jgi:delta1-piperideine-2-carboxylate reductase
MTDVTLTLDEARDLAARCLLANGCDEANAAAVAGNMMRAERDLCSSHGLFRLPWHVHSLRCGKANGRARPRVESIAPAVIKVHGDRGFAPLGHEVGRAPLIDAAHRNGIAAMAYVDMYHIAALWPEVESLADEGLIALAYTASLPYVAPPGGKKPLFGTNPMAFAWPRRGKPPLVFDQASAAMARGEIMIAAREKRQLPEGAGIDAAGRPTRDPDLVLKGAQLPFGGYKGASLALMIELLAGPLMGDFLSIEAEEDDAGAGAGPHGGELILALDPQRFRPDGGHLNHAEKLFARLANEEGVRLPGERRLKSRAVTQRKGIAIPKSLHETILGLLG